MAYTALGLPGKKPVALSRANANYSGGSVRDFSKISLPDSLLSKQHLIDFIKFVPIIH